MNLHGLEFELEDYDYIFDGVRMILNGKHPQSTPYRGSENNKPYILPKDQWYKLFMMEAITVPHGKNWRIIPQKD